jgi:hypothetical protein
MAVGIKMVDVVQFVDERPSDKIHGVTPRKVVIFSVPDTKGFVRWDRGLLTSVTYTSTISTYFPLFFNSCWHASCNLWSVPRILPSISHSWIFKASRFCDPEDGSAKTC